jgi:hypothetical protein
MKTYAELRKELLAYLLAEVSRYVDGKISGSDLDKLAQITLRFMREEGLLDLELPATEKAEWLIWSSHHSSWWGPDGYGYTQDVWRAGRYTRTATKPHLHRGGWPRPDQQNQPPPEVVVLAPEAGQETLTPEFLATVRGLMRDRIVEATKERIAEEVSA